MKNNTNHAKKDKLVNVKGTLVNDKDGAYLRKAHQRKQEVNVDDQRLQERLKNSKYPIVTKALHNTMKEGKVSNVNNMKRRDGITKGIKIVELKDANGKKQRGYFKDVDNEPFVDGGYFSRGTIRLNDRKTNETLSDAFAYKKLPDEKNLGRDRLKGHLLDREVATATLGKILGMDHLPDAAVRKIDYGDGKDARLGILVRDIHEQFNPTKRAEIEKAGDHRTPQPAVRATDKKLGDKLAFDLLIGNTDRHRYNQMVKTSGGKSEMLAFDQGLSFPNGNDAYVNRDFGNQYSFLHEAGDVSFTSSFIENFGKFLSNGDFEKFTEYVKDNIGIKESNAFTERVSFFASKIFKDKLTTVSKMEFPKHIQKT